GDVARAILGLPGEAFTQGVPLHLIAEALDGSALARLPGTLAELHDAAAEAASQRAQQQTEGGRRLAFALAGVDDQQALFDGLAGHFRVLNGLAIGHLGLVPLRLVICRCHAGRMVGKALVIKPPGPYHNRDGAPHGDQKGTRCKSAAAPATVVGELTATCHWKYRKGTPGRRPAARTREPGNLPS